MIQSRHAESNYLMQLPRLRFLPGRSQSLHGPRLFAVSR